MYINQNPEVVLADIAQELQSEYESRQYTQKQKLSREEQRLAGDLLLLREIFKVGKHA